jgi:acyl carrier protein phosphodiesterase
LFNYQFKKGIKSVLNGMNRRTKNLGQMDLAIDDLYELDSEFEKDFKLFFEDLRIFTNQKLVELQLSNPTS